MEFVYPLLTEKSFEVLAETTKKYMFTHLSYVGTKKF
jgi:hypothetical protein